MIHKLLTFALVTALCTPAFAQRMGGSNRNAPEVKQSIGAEDLAITLNYTSITWANGEAMKAITDKENGGRLRERVNRSAPSSPLGTFKSNMPLACGDLSLPAGDYEIYYTINDDCEWQINFHKDGEAMMVATPGLVEELTEKGFSNMKGILFEATSIASS